MFRTIEFSQTQIVSVSSCEMDKIKHAFDWSPMPANSDEIIIEVNDDNIEEVIEILSEEVSTGYIVFHVVNQQQ